MPLTKNAAPYLRKIAVTLGPLEEWRGLKRGTVIGFGSDGTFNGLRVTANINSTIMGVPTPSTISIYNLARDTRDAIKGSLTKVTLQAGWNNSNMITVFQGALLSVVSSRAGSDIITKLSALPGYGALVRGVSSVSFGPNTDINFAIKKLANDLPGVTVTDGNIQNIKGAIGQGGWSYAGSTKDGLNALAKEHGFSWSINNGNFTAISDTFMLGNYVELQGGDGGLISVNPILTGPLQVQTGVKVKALYTPGIKAGSTIKVNSELNPRLNKTYRVHTIGVSLDAYSENWTMDIESYKYFT